MIIPACVKLTQNQPVQMAWLFDFREYYGDILELYTCYSNISPKFILLKLPIENICLIHCYEIDILIQQHKKVNLFFCLFKVDL